MSSDRIVVENFFGRASSLFGMMTKKFVWNRDRFDTVVDVCFSLTNYHLRLHPMREEDVMYYQRVLSGMAIRTEEVKNYARARQLKHRSKRRALEIALESDYEEEEGYGNLTNRHNFDDEVVIEGVSNNNGNDDDSNCSNNLCARDEGMNDHDGEEIFTIPSSKELGLGSSDNESDSSFSTAKKTNLSDSEFSSSNLSVVSQRESKKVNRKPSQDNMKNHRRKVNKKRNGRKSRR